MTVSELPEPPISDPQRAAVFAHLASFVTEMHSLTAAAETLIEDPGQDDAHAYVEAISLAARARKVSVLRAEAMAYAAHQSPASVSIPRLARALQMSVNTLRSRLPRVAKTPDEADTFHAF